MWTYGVLNLQCGCVIPAASVYTDSLIAQFMQRNKHNMVAGEKFVHSVKSATIGLQERRRVIRLYSFTKKATEDLVKKNLKSQVCNIRQTL